jgi:diguanylate cyclase (GGDEF)-like protein/PAS domain S-box-containing protein
LGQSFGRETWIQGNLVDKQAFAGERRGLLPAYGQVFEHADQALQMSEERYRYTVALSPLIPWIADSSGGMVDIDMRGLEYTGLSYEQCMGTGFLAAIHATDRTTVKAVWANARLTGEPIDYEMRLRRHDGSFRWQRCRAAPRMQRGGGILCWYGTIEDVDDRKRASEAIRWSAEHDDLTNLRNRRAFIAAFGTALAGAEGTDIEVGLLLIDLDGFKLVNDRYGHDAGDALLKEVAARLETIGTGDALAGRLGGDEFAMLVYTADHERLDGAIAEVRRALAATYSFKGQSHTCGASIGVALYPRHGTDPADLYRNADLALYEAKAAGGEVRFFESSMRARLQRRMSELSVARHALDHDEVFPFYQPKINLNSGAIVGFEALLRWNDRTRGVQSPGLIRAALEDAQLAVELDERIFEHVAASIKSWTQEGFQFGRIAINVSAAEFGRKGFADELLQRAAQAGISASSLELEVTETVFLGRSVPDILAMFVCLRAAGMTIALDDFGTGYASLIHLKQFPIDVLKIDCSFVRSLDDPVNAAIVQSIVDLGKRLGITTVAEGIETEAQAAWLYEKGCDLAQGYLFSPAVAPDHVQKLITEPNRLWCSVDRRSGKDRREPSSPNFP